MFYNGIMVIDVVERNKTKVREPRFINPAELTEAQLTDPDYRLKQLAKLNGGKLDITCSKCHHCR